MVVEGVNLEDSSREELLAKLTRLRKVVKTLQGSEERYKTLFQRSEDGIILQELLPEGPRVLDCNARALELYEFDRIEDFSGFTGPWEKSPSTQPDGSPSKEKAIALLEAAMEGEPQDYYWQHMKKDGALIDTEISLIPMMLGDKNCIQAVIRDVSDRRKTQAALFTSEKRYRKLFDYTSNAVAIHEIVLDDDGNPVDYIFLEVNPAFERITKLTAEEIIGKRVTEVLPGIEDTHLINTYGKVALKGDPTSFDIFFEPLGKHFEVAAFSHQKNQFAAVFSDVTERKHREEEIKASLKEKETLLTEVHHRVKNNMQVIASLFSLQTMSMPEGDARSFLEDMQGRVNSMAKVHEVLYSSSSLTEVPFDWYLNSLVTALVGMGSREAHISTDFELEKVMVDAKRAISLGLIVNEIVTNSIKHAFPSGRDGTISVELKRLNGNVMVCVKDDGIGLPESMDPENTRSLGLRLIDLLRKQIGATVELSKEQGTEYIFSFPHNVED